MSYQLRRNYGDNFIPQASVRLANYFKCSPEQIVTSTFFEDVNEATDLKGPNGERIALRVRKKQYKERYYGQFTVRLSGDCSEQTKLDYGLADYIFYAYAASDDPQETRLDSWWLMSVDAMAFRYLLGQQTNGKDSVFNAYLFNPYFVAASSEQFPYGGRMQ